MAKLSIDLDLDYLEEGQTIDEFVRDEIVNAAIRRVETTIFKQAEANLAEKVGAIIDKRVEEITNKIIDDFVTTQKFPCPKNSWDQNPEFKTIPEILTEKLEKALTQTVDENGRPSSSYSSRGTRIDWLTGKLAEKYADEKIQAYTKDIKGHIEKYIVDKVKGQIMEQLSQAVLKNIDFGKI